MNERFIEISYQELWPRQQSIIKAMQFLWHCYARFYDIHAPNFHENLFMIWASDYHEMRVKANRYDELCRKVDHSSIVKDELDLQNPSGT